ncbi:MAG TPA: hypothetical protein VFR33_01055 [Candidatus Dormibacteraeota bacterium]|nr:hypothetical protein [Candidatus Dormibacteraeota bacterium]
MSQPTPLRLRPLEIGDLLDETFRMYRRHFLLFAGISVILSIPSAALFGLALASLSSVMQQTNGQTTDLSFLTPLLAGLGAGLLVNLIFLPFTYGAIVYAASESALGRPVTAGGVLSGVLRRYFALLGYWLLFLVSFYVSLILCVVPVALWAWVFVGWIVVTPAMFVENIGLGTAFGRSWWLVQGRWWRTFLALFLIAIIWYIAGIALGAFLQLGSFLLELIVSPFIAAAISSAIGQVVAALVTPILQIAVVLVYFDLRVRKEGLDLFQMAYQLAPPQATT